MTTTIGISVHEGIGIYHTPREASQIARLVIAANVLWILVVNITKASLLTQYLRIFCSFRTRTLCYLLLFSLLPAATYAIFGGIFLCHPTAKLWNPKLEGTCRSAQTYWLSVAGLDISLDFLVLLLPLPSILSLRLPGRKQKIALVLVFTLGFLVCLVSVARLVTVYLTARQGKYVTSGVWAVIWSAVEANVGIICACLLALKPLAAKLLPSLFDETRLPEHCMRLTPVDTRGARWSQVRGMGASGWPPATPSSGVSKHKDRLHGSFGVRRWSAARMWVAPEMREGDVQGLSEVEGVGVVHGEEADERHARRGDGGGAGGGGEQRVSIWDMLQQPEEVAFRDRVGREARR